MKPNLRKGGIIKSKVRQPKNLNMVRAGVVEHPKDWPHGGYIEIQRPRRKNILIDYGALAHLCGYNDLENFQSAHRSWIEAALSGNQIKRDEFWTQSIAIGNRSYVESIKRRLGGNAIGRARSGAFRAFRARSGTTSAFRDGAFRDDH